MKNLHVYGFALIGGVGSEPVIENAQIIESVQPSGDIEKAVIQLCVAICTVLVTWAMQAVKELVKTKFQKGGTIK